MAASAPSLPHHSAIRLVSCVVSSSKAVRLWDSLSNTAAGAVCVKHLCLVGGGCGGGGCPQGGGCLCLCWQAFVGGATIWDMLRNPAGSLSLAVGMRPAGSLSLAVGTRPSFPEAWRLSKRVNVSCTPSLLVPPVCACVCALTHSLTHSQAERSTWDVSAQRHSALVLPVQPAGLGMG